MNQISRFLLLGLVFLCLFSTVLTLVYKNLTTELAERVANNHLVEVFPNEEIGAIIEDIPLGSSEFIEQKAILKLAYDDYINRSYSSQGNTFSVYVGYWRSGRFSPSFIAAHTPDRCWTLSGMKCSDFATGHDVMGEKITIPNAEWRRFYSNSEKGIYVVYWHLIGQELYDYGGRFHSYTSPDMRIRDVIFDLFSSNEDQYFIRISSEKPFEKLKYDPLFNQVLESLGSLGLDTKSST